jgi:hypothetical protein
MLVLALCSASGTHGIGDSYVFGDIFQPSTLGSLGLLGAATAFCLGSARWSGLSLAFAGAFHVNYLLLGLCVFGVAWLASGAERRLVRGAWLLGPSLIVLAWSVPFLLASSGSALAAESRRIFQEVRAPHHYDVERFVEDFVPWLGFQLLGAWALWASWRQAQTPRRRLLTLLLGFWLLIIPAALLSYFGVRSVNQLFAWRIAPHGSLLAQVAFTGVLIERLTSREGPALAASAAERWLAAAGLGALVLDAALGTSRDVSLLTLCIAAAALAHQRWTRFLTADQSWRIVATASAAAFLLAIASPLSKVGKRSDLLSGKDRDLAELCQWLQRSSSRETILLTPPDEAEVRFRCERAIVVDWKSTPVIPEQVMTWVERMEDVTGQRPLRGPSDTRGYVDLDLTRLKALKEKYGFEIVVLKRGTPLIDELPPADFAYGRFVAYRLDRTTSNAGARTGPDAQNAAATRTVPISAR